MDSTNQPKTLRINNYNKKNNQLSSKNTKKRSSRTFPDAIDDPSPRTEPVEVPRRLLPRHSRILHHLIEGGRRRLRPDLGGLVDEKREGGKEEGERPPPRHRPPETALRPAALPPGSDPNSAGEVLGIGVGDGDGEAAEHGRRHRRP